MKRNYLILLFNLSVVFGIFTADRALSQGTIPSSAGEEWLVECVDRSLNLNGDIQSSNTFLFWLDGQWSVGPAVSTQLVKYDLGEGEAGLNLGIGAGAAFRFYPDIKIKDENGDEIEKIKISQVKQKCRQTSFARDVAGTNGETPYLAAPLFSITPTLYTTQEVNEDEFSVQPAIVFGFFEDIINFGVGYNLTGPDEEEGNVFLLFGIGLGFRF